MRGHVRAGCECDQCLHQLRALHHRQRPSRDRCGTVSEPPIVTLVELPGNTCRFVTQSCLLSACAVPLHRPSPSTPWVSPSRTLPVTLNRAAGTVLSSLLTMRAVPLCSRPDCAGRYRAADIVLISFSFLFSGLITCALPAGINIQPQGGSRCAVDGFLVNPRSYSGACLEHPSLHIQLLVAFILAGINIEPQLILIGPTGDSITPQGDYISMCLLCSGHWPARFNADLLHAARDSPLVFSCFSGVIIQPELVGGASFLSLACSCCMHSAAFAV